MLFLVSLSSLSTASDSSVCVAYEVANAGIKPSQSAPAKNPEFQEYLKIDDGFAFFMDLTKYRILGDLLNKMHQERDRQVHEEIKQGRGVILDYQNFEGRYGKKNSSIYFNLQNIHPINLLKCNM